MLNEALIVWAGVFGRGLIVGVLGLLGCTTPNPRDCSDGTCTDPAFPFCDVEGAFGDTTNTCIAVTCVPGEVAACREDRALTCNAVGNDFDIVDCPLGCDAVTGCKTCNTDDQCENATPICDTTSSTCRTCANDDECPSRICSDDGSCLAQASVVYAASNGSDSSDCSQAAPCAINRAALVAVAVNPQPSMRLLPGVYANGLNIPLSPTPLEIVGTGATIVAPTAVTVKNGARARIRGLTMISLNFAVECGTSGAPLSSITMRDSIAENGSTSGTFFTVGNCNVDLAGMELRLANSTGAAIALGTDATFTGDRLRIHGGTNSAFGMLGQRVSLKLTNSVLEDVQFLFQTNDSTGVGSQASIAYNTLVMTSQFNNVSCVADSGTPFRHILFENNIIVASGSTTAVDGTGCTLTNNLLFPQASPPATNIVADPQFVDAAAKDFHLQPGSPAIDAARTPPTIFTDHAFDGTPRPQGAKPDIGAFEQ